MLESQVILYTIFQCFCFTLDFAAQSQTWYRIRGKSAINLRTVNRILIFKFSVLTVYIKSQIVLIQMATNFLVMFEIRKQLNSNLGLIALLISMIQVITFYIPLVIKFNIANKYFNHTVSFRTIICIVMYCIILLFNIVTSAFGISIAIAVMTYIFPDIFIWFYVLPFCYLVPQIITCYTEKYKQIWISMEPLSTLSLFLPLIYFVGCPGNIAGLSCDPTVLWIIGSLLLVQYNITIHQYYKGRKLYGNVRVRIGLNQHSEDSFSFYQTVDHKDIGLITLILENNKKNFNSTVDNVDCSICLQDIIVKESQVIQIKSENQKFAFTQCKHHFHITCLDDWLEYHLTCPFCRQNLS